MLPVYVNTLPGMTSIGIPIAKSTPVTQTGLIPSMTISTSHVLDILERSSNEQARAAYLERQIRNMGSVQISSSIPPLEDDITLENEGLFRRIQDYCLRIKYHRKCEKDIHQLTLNSIKEYKEKQQQQKERDEIYAKMSQNLERVRDIVGGTLRGVYYFGGRTSNGFDGN